MAIKARFHIRLFDIQQMVNETRWKIEWHKTKKQKPYIFAIEFVCRCGYDLFIYTSYYDMAEKSESAKKLPCHTYVVRQCKIFAHRKYTIYISE